MSKYFSCNFLSATFKNECVTIWKLDVYQCNLVVYKGNINNNNLMYISNNN